jgi:hypothetical protein
MRNGITHDFFCLSHAVSFPEELGAIYFIICRYRESIRSFFGQLSGKGKAEQAACLNVVP